MSREKRKVESSLQKKGFQETSGDHRFFSYYTIDGKKTEIQTKTSHTPKMKTIPDSLISKMAKQCKLNNKDFSDLIDCPLSREAYEKKLRENSEI